jgi:SAM-dependent methyltransferase
MKSIDPTPLVRLSTAYWDSQVFLTANRVRLFDLIGQDTLSAEDVAARLGALPRNTRLFLNACAGLGLLAVNGGRYSNNDLGKAFLIKASPGYMGNSVLYSDHLYGTWGQLERGLRQADPVLPPQSYLGDDETRTRAFVYGMHDRALGLASSLVSLVDLTGRKALLDVGGGPGTYSIMLTKQYTGLKSTVLELAGVARVAQEIVNAHAAADRVTMLVGDYHSTPFPPGRDAVLMSGMFHRETEATCRDLIQRARGCLQPGGVVAISDIFADAGGATPAFAALFGLNMMLTAPDGGVHADADIAAWMRDAGFRNVETRNFPPPMPHRVVLGIAP